MFGLGDLIGLGSGLLGMANASSAADEQNRLMQQSLDLQRQGLGLNQQIAGPQISAENSLLGIANNYDPIAEAQAGVKRAGDVFNTALQQGLGGVASSFAGAGSMPGMSSEFNVRSQDVANRVSDPFRAYLADAYGNPSEKRAAMFQRVLASAPSGGLSDAYFKAAGQNMGMVGAFQPNYGPALGTIGNTLDRIFPSAGAQPAGIIGPDSSNPFYRTGQSNNNGYGF